MFSRFAPVAAALVAVNLVAAPAFAQSPPAAPPAPPVVAGWQNGFFVQSANGDYRAVLGLVVQTDGRFSLDDPSPIINTFTIRKLRPTLTGRIGKYFDFKIMPDFGNGTTVVQDAYFDVRFSPALRVRIGKDKTPVSHEVLVGDAALVFPERAQPFNLMPNRDVGIQVQGDLAGGKVFYAGGVMNGVVDGTSSSTDVDTNSGKDLVGRIVVQPFRTSAPAGPRNGLGFQVGGSSGKQAGTLPTFRTSILQTYFSYAAAGNGLPAAVASGRRTRVTPAVFYYYKTFGVFAEYARSTQAVSRGGPSQDIANQGWDVTGIYNLTGEPATAGLVAPTRTFDPPTGKWGALQIVARAAELKVDDMAFDAGFAAAGASRRAQQTTVGVNWYPLQYVKYYLNYERIVFDKNVPGARPIEHSIFLRVQLAF